MTLNYYILLFSTMLGCQHVSLGCWNGITNGLDVFRKSKNDAFDLWCWRRLLRVPWTARRSNQFILKEINPEYTLVLKLKLKYLATRCEEPTHWKTLSTWEILRAGGEGDNRG